jgi:signal transduction histidine kinase
MLMLILLVTTSIYFWFSKISSDRDLGQLSEQTDTIVRTLNANPDIVARELMDAFLPAHGMIRVIREDGEAFVTQYKQKEYTNLPATFTVNESQQIVKDGDGIKVAVIEKPMIWKDGEVVTLQVSNHLLGLQEDMKTLFYVLVAVSMIMLLPTIVAGGLLSQFLLRPIKKLIQTMKENIRNKDWKKIDIQNRSHDELHEMENTFNEMIDYLKANFQKQEIFVSNASHELKTPISIIKSYAQLLDRRARDNPEVLNESTRAIESEADRMQKLVEQMLLLARNKNESSMAKVDLAGLCEETIATFTGAYTRDIQFHQMVNGLHVKGNKEQLQQIIYILIDNALKYSQDEVKFMAFAHDHQAIIKITDYGQGIPDEDLPHIFDRFYRVDKARTRETGGTGLGLTIAKSIAELHQGDLSVTSKLEEGTTFTLNLPLWVED